VDKKPGSANRLVPLSTVYIERFLKWRQMLSFVEEGRTGFGCFSFRTAAYAFWISKMV